MSKISTYEVAPVPKLSDKLIGTSVGGEIEDVTYNFTLQELLDVFLPVIPANNLQGILDYGNTATQDINLFGTITTTNLDVTDTANLFITYLNEETHLVGSLFDSADSVGTAGQVLTSTGDGVEWFTLPPIFTPNLQQVLEEGNTADLDIILDANLEALDVSADTATVGVNLTLGGTITDNNSSVGSAGQVLESTVTGVQWTNLPVYSATSPLLFNSGTNTFSIQVANSTQGGYLTASDWVTFDGKQNAGSYITALTGEATATGPGSVPITLNNASVIAKVLTGLNVTGGSISASDSILTAFGKVQNQINGLIGGVQYQGTWNAATNTPTLTSSVGTQGHFYIVSVAGNTDLNGITDWKIGDWAIFSGGAWSKVDNTESVTSVNGQIGAVSLTTDDIPEGATNLYYLDSRARGALSFAAGSGAYNSLTGVITIPTNNNQILNGANYITLGSLSASSPLVYNNLTGAFSIPQATSLVDGYLSATDWSTFNNKQNYLGGTGLVKSTAGTITYITDNSSNWNTAYNDSIISASVTGTTTKTLTLNQQDGGTIQASWTDLDTGLTSVGVSMPAAFSVANSPLTANGTIAITGAGTTLQYIDGTGALQTFPGLTGFVPYTGANQNVNLGEYGISAGYFQADLTPTGALQVGRMQWNSTDGTMDLRLLGNNVTLQIGEENVSRVVNKSGIDLLEENYQVVRLRKVAEGGAQGQRIAVVLAQGNSENNSTEVLGLVTETINANQEGFITCFGEVKEINTTGSLQGETWVDGDILYLSSTVAGALTNVRPVAPNHSVIVGYVSYAHAIHGKIYMAIDTGYELGELHNVYAPSPTNNQSIYWNSTNSRYQLNTIGGILGYTPANAATLISTTAPLQGGGDLSANRTLSITQAGASTDGYLSSTDWNTFNNKQPAGSYVPTSRLLSINGTQYDLSADRSWSVGTVTSVAALTLGTSGTDLSSSVANGTTTPVITLNVPTASAANRGALSAADWSTFNTKVGGVTASSPLASSGGQTPNITIQQASGSQDGYLSSTDWTTFNNKQAAGNYITSLTGEATASGPGAAAVTLNNASVTGKVLTGVNITGGSISASDSILTAFGKVQNQINGLIGSTIYQGTWNAATNTPALASGVGIRGYYYIVNVAGTTNLDGITDWFVGDWAIFDGTAWQQVDNTDAVVSVNGQTGAVSLTTDNIPEGATNQYFLNSRARAALSFTAGSGAYNSTTGVITIPTNTSQLTNGANFITLASLSGTAPIQYNNTTGAISITQSGTASNGFLSSTDWNTFNNKQSALTNPVTGTGTTNYLPKFTGTSTIGNSALQDDGSTVTITSLTKNVGEFRIYPSSGTAVLRFGSGSTEKGKLSVDTSSNMIFETGGSEQMRLDVSGNLSIAQGNAPTQVLNLYRAGSTQTVMAVGNSNTGLNGTYFGVDANGNGIMNTTGAFANIFSTNGSEQMRLNASGNLGLGTTNPDVFSRGYSGKILGISSGGQSAIQLNAATGSAAYFDMGVNGTRYLGFYTDTTSSDISTIGAYPLSLSTNSVPRLTIASTGAATFSSLAGSGTRIVVADANGTLSASSALSGYITGSGTTNYVPKFTSASAIGNSLIYDNGSGVAINSASIGNTTFKVNATGLSQTVSAVDIIASGSGTFQRGIRMLNSGMVSGESLIYMVGQGEGIKNTGQLYFYYAGGNSNSNRLSLGLYAVDDVFNIFGSSNIAIGTTTDSGYKLDVNGTGRFSGSVQEMLYVNSSVTSGTVFRLSNTSTGGGDFRFYSTGSGNGEGAGRLVLNFNGSSALLNISGSTGAATFISSVTAQSGIFGNSGSGSYSLRVANNDQSNVRINIVNSGSGGQEFSIIGGLAGASNAGFSIYDNTNASTRFYINSTGVATINNLAGTGTRIVVADASGTLSATSALSGYVTGSGTTNYVPKWTSSSAIGNSLIYDGGSSLGIGTTTPSNTAGFSRQVQIEGTYPALTLKNVTGVAGWYSLGAGSNGDFGIWNNTTSSYPIYIPSSNNILIGATTDSGHKLQVNGNAAINGTVIGTDQTFGGAYRTFAFGANSNGYNRIFAANDTSDGLYLNAATGRGIYFRVNGGGANVVSIESTGAATFSSSVTALSITGTNSVNTSGGMTIANDLTWTNNVGYGLKGQDGTRFLAFTTSGTVLDTSSIIQFLTSGSEKMRISNGGNVGIGTTSPSQKLETVGIIKSSGNSSSLMFENRSAFGNTWEWYSQGAVGSSFAGLYKNYNTSGTVFAITDVGNVGIGTTTPNYKLEVQDNSSYTALLLFNTKGSAGGTSAVQFGLSDGAFVTGDAARVQARIINVSNSALDFKAYGGGLNTIMTLQGNGNVGIGTTSPTNKLTIQSNSTQLRLETASDPGSYYSFIESNYNAANPLNIYSSAAASYAFGTIALAGISGVNTYVHSYYGLIFGTGGSLISSGTVRGMVTNGGNWLIGTTTDYGYKLNVSGTTQLRDNVQINNGTGGTSPKIAFGTEDPSVQGFKGIYLDTYWMYMQVHYNEGLRIRAVNGVGGSQTIATFAGAAGTLVTLGSITAPAFYESSDSRLKQLIKDNYRALGIEAIKPKLYIKNGKEEVGYFAQEVQGILSTAVDINDEGFLNLSYTQVHTAKIAIIEDEVDVLKRRVTELESKLQKYEA